MILTETRKKYWFFTRNWVKEENVHGNQEFTNGLRDILHEWCLREKHSIIFQTERGPRLVANDNDRKTNGLARPNDIEDRKRNEPCGHTTMPKLLARSINGRRTHMLLRGRGTMARPQKRPTRDNDTDSRDVLRNVSQKHTDVQDNQRNETMRLQRKRQNGILTPGSNENIDESQRQMVGSGRQQGGRAGNADGNLHWQGVLILHSKRSRRTLLAHAKGTPLEGANWAPARSVQHAINYVTKEETRINGPYWRGIEAGKHKPAQPAIDYYSHDDATAWQLEILKRIGTPCTIGDRRRINWFWSKYGGVGKSTLARHIVGFSFAGRSILIGGGRRDAFYALTARAEETKENLEVVVVDLPRANVQRDDDGVEFASISSATLEGISNGIWFNTKYECKHFILGRPAHIIVFANAPPEYKKMSADRWHVTQILTTQNLGENPSEY